MAFILISKCRYYFDSAFLLLYSMLHLWPYKWRNKLLALQIHNTCFFYALIYFMMSNWFIELFLQYYLSENEISKNDISLCPGWIRTIDGCYFKSSPGNVNFSSQSYIINVIKCMNDLRILIDQIFTTIWNSYGKLTW